MVTAIVVLGLCAAVVQGVPFKRQFECPDGHWCHPYIQGKRQSFGACVEMCSPAGSGRLDSCPAGYACMSNGCGHTCQSVMLKGRSMVVPTGQPTPRAIQPKG